MIHHVTIAVYFICVVHPSTQQYDIDILDNCAPNTNVLDLNTLINPQTSQSKVKYTLSKMYKASEYFVIKNEKIFTKATIDIDNMCTAIRECCNKDIDYCILRIAIFYTADQSFLTNMRILQVHIKDINDHSPRFDRSSFDIELSELKKDPFNIILPLAQDEDFGRNRIQNYEIGRKEPLLFDDYFSLVVNKDSSLPSQVVLRLNKLLDRETISHFSFELLAIDDDLAMKKTGLTQINVKLIDENDNRPVFEKSLYSEVIKEGFINNQPIVTLSATDIDEDENARILYNFSQTFLTDPVINQQFRIEPNGKIYLKQSLDYEKKSSYRFLVIATNPTMFSNSRLTPATATVEIEVENVYDEPLQIIVDYVGGKNWSQINENRHDVFIAFVTTRSIESGRKNFGISCKLKSFENIFDVTPKNNDDPNTKSFEVRIIKGIDRETNPRIETTIVCLESNSVNGRSSEAPLMVIIMDENDNAPELSIEGKPNVLENEEIGKIIFTVKANDPDDGENGRVSFTLDKSESVSLEYLSIGETDGKVVVNNKIDCEATYNPLTYLVIVVTATDHGKVPRSTDLKIHVHVQDVNDNVPTFNGLPLQFTIVENSPKFTSIGEIEVRDRDHNDKITVHILNNNQMLLPFIISTKENKFFSLNSTRSIDREKEVMFKFQIVAADGIGINAHSVTETIEVKVMDLNDNSPTIIFPTQNNASVHRISYLEPANHKFILVSANDQDQLPDNSRLEYAVEDDSKIFGITNEDKFITTQRELTKSDIGSHKIRIVVRDCGLPRLESSVTINIVIDQSPPKSLSSANNHRYNNGNVDRPSDNISANSDIILYVTVIIILLVIIIVVIIFVYFLRRCKKEDNCLYLTLSTCCQSPESSSSPDVSKSMISSPTPKFNIHDDKQIYNNQVLDIHTY